ncbi:choice-of-anchor J domain-containing protein, partial [Flavobacterium sp.]|uniref:choice-of-anchor J domain-containing protein n=1 Tax=Flavobacterium sp. TaxID=239 RepID=UPI003F69B8B4
MKKITLILLMTFSSLVGFSQIVLEEGFEGTNLPEASGNWTLGSGNWRVFDNGIGLNNTWEVVASPDPAVYAGTRSAYLNRENVTNGTFASDWLVTPQITVPANGQLRFFARQVTGGNAGSVYTVRVSTSSNPQASLVAGDFTTVQTYSETGVGNPAINTVNGVYEEQLVSLAAYPAGTQVYIAFEMTNDFGDRFLLDDVKVVSQCLDPTLLTATNIGLNSASLGWTNNSTATNFEVEVFEANGLASLGVIPATGTSVSYPGLMPSTAYQFYVRALCADGINSEWAGPFNFTTSSPGQTCDAPITVASIPYQVSGSTLGFGDDYSGSPGTSCSTTAGYLNGDDVFYTFVADNNDPIKITNQTNTNWSGLFVYTGCSNVGVSCVAGSTAGNGNTTADQVIFTPVAGQTYYVVISTFAGTNGTNQSCDYTLTIVKNTCTNLSATFNVVSNCSVTPDTFFVTANVSNMGSATSIVGVTIPVSSTETLLAPGTMQFGPFPNGTNVTINLQNATDNNCFKNSPILTQTFCPATNDLCANPIDISCGSTFTQTTVGANSTGAPTVACGTGPGSGGLWYKYAGNGDVVTFSLCGSTFNTKLQVYTGNCSGLTCVDGNDDFCGTQSQVQITTVTGQDYYVYVYGSGTAQGEFILNTTCITPAAPPANDNCDAAVPAVVNTDGTCDLTTSGTVEGATPSSQTNICIGTADDDVWYSFVASNAIHTFNLLNVSGSDTDLNYAVYSSSNATTPCDGLTQILCSPDNFNVAGNLTPGQTYYVRIYTATNVPLQDTIFDLCISTPPPAPSNDECSTAIVAPVNSSIVCNAVTPGTITSATPSIQPTTCGGAGSANDDVWFQFTAVGNIQNIALNNVQGTTTDLAFAVYEGPNCNSLSQINCQTNNNGIVSGLTIGGVYWIRIFSQSTASNLFSNFDLCITTPIQCNTAQPFCGENNEIFISQTGLPSAGSPGCLGSAPNPVWFKFKVETTGNITFDLTQTNNATGNPIDVDFILWGPFTDAQMDSNACNSLYDYPDGNTTIPNNIVDCSYSASAFEFIDIPNAIAGQNYLLLVTNFNGAAGTFSLTQSGTSTGSAFCCTVDLGQDIVLCDETSYTITAVTNNDDAIVWYKDDVLIPGASANTLVVTETGNYKCEITCGQLTVSDTKLVTFNTSVVPTFDPIQMTYCQNETAQTLPTTPTNNISGSWSPSTIDTTTPGTITYTYSPDAGLCATPFTVDITVNTFAVPTFTQIPNFCQGTTAPTLPTTSNNGFVGTWDAAIDNSIVGAQTFTFTPDDLNCTSTTTMTVTVDAPSIVPTFTQIPNFCQGTTAPTLPTTSNNGILGTWDNTLDNSVTGAQTVTFTPSAGQCAVSTTMTVTVVAPSIVPTFTQIGDFCQGTTAPTLPTMSTNGITGVWNSALNNAISGPQTVTFTPNNGQCAVITTITVNVIPTATLDPLANTSVTACNSFVLPSLISGNS